MTKKPLFTPQGLYEEEKDFILRTKINQYQERLDKDNQVVQVLYWDDQLLYEDESGNMFEILILIRLLSDPHLIITNHR